MFALTLLAALALPTPPVAATAATAHDMKLYTLDCGRLELPDMGMFSDTGENAGKPGIMAVPCYLIRHGDSWMLWDTGLGDAIAAIPNGETKLGGKWTVRRTLASQLAELGLKPDDIRYVALSHLHADHSGNVGLFPKATFLIAGEEVDWAKGRPTPLGVDAVTAEVLARDHVQRLDGDVDVFGDGSVSILRAPGHTPGHRILLLKLPQAGAVLLSGDLFHTRENFDKSLVPGVNVDRPDTLASFDRFHRLADHYHARIVIQHAMEDFDAMPKFPKALD